MLACTHCKQEIEVRKLPHQGLLKKFQGMHSSRWNHIGVQLDYPVSLGEYAFSSGPDEPVIVTTYRYPHMSARKPFGRITIANADSAASAMLEAAVEQGHRAVTELL